MPANARLFTRDVVGVAEQRDDALLRFRGLAPAAFRAVRVAQCGREPRALRVERNRLLERRGGGGPVADLLARAPEEREDPRFARMAETRVFEVGDRFLRPMAREARLGARDDRLDRVVGCSPEDGASAIRTSGAERTAAGLERLVLALAA